MISRLQRPPRSPSFIPPRFLSSLYHHSACPTPPNTGSIIVMISRPSGRSSRRASRRAAVRDMVQTRDEGHRVKGPVRIVEVGGVLDDVHPAAPRVNVDPLAVAVAVDQRVRTGADVQKPAPDVRQHGAQAFFFEGGP